MKLIKNIVCAGCLAFLFTSCRKDEAINVIEPVGLGGDVTAVTAIDKWISDSLVRPYNIAVNYRWDPSNASIFKTLTPTDESRIIPLLSAIKKVWINPYTQETGSELFMKKYAPKQFVLIGSVQYDFYSVTLGQAEGGNNIVFFDVNQNFDKNPVTSISRVIHTAHHEFGHILHQTVLYPQDFRGVSSKLGLAGYTPTWFNISDEDAINNGYATSYSMSGPDDDFVEMIATMLTQGRGKWEEMKASANEIARQALQQKEDFVVTYYRQVWNIDFYSLQARVQAELLALYPVPSVADTYGFGKVYGEASVNPANTTQLPQPAASLALFNAAKSGLAAIVSGGISGRVLDSFSILYNSPSSVLLVCYFHNPATPDNVQFALYQYAITRDASNIYTFTFNNFNENGNNFRTGLAPLVNYFATNKFAISWYADPSVSSHPRIRFTPQAIPGTYFNALLIP